MKRLLFSALTILPLLCSQLSAADDKANGDPTTKKEKKEARKAVKEAVAEKNDDLPPEMRTPRADARMERLRQLIVQGIREKQLTAGEVTSATNELKRIEREQETYQHNKRVGPRERNDLKRDLNKLHESLWEKTHNGNKPTEPLEK